MRKQKISRINLDLWHSSLFYFPFLEEKKLWYSLYREWYLGLCIKDYSKFLRKFCSVSFTFLPDGVGLRLKRTISSFSCSQEYKRFTRSDQKSILSHLTQSPWNSENYAFLFALSLLSVLLGVTVIKKSVSLRFGWFIICFPANPLAMA